MKRIWADTNFIIRLVTDDPKEMADRAESFLQKAEAGEFRIVIAPIVVAECVWVLTGRYYQASKASAVNVLTKFLGNSGLDVLDEVNVLQALTLMESKRVDFIDAYLAVQARSQNESVANFDRDYRKLGVERVAIE